MPAGLSLICSGNNSRANWPPRNSASAASEERNQQSPRAPCWMSSAQGSPRKSCQSMPDIPSMFQKSPIMGALPSVDVIWPGRHHFVTLSRRVGGKSGSSNRRFSDLQRSSSALNRCRMSTPPSDIDMVPDSSGGGSGAAARSCRRQRCISGGRTHFTIWSCSHTTHTLPAGIRRWPTNPSAVNTSRTSPRNHLRNELLHTSTGSPT
mmetsp:Transcript_44012/g.141112  ORF Transcript_44012/g.141112 Transcript_44012/m.141112 type:complete len:207 (+) Transcript_44012:1627-2247(+)